MTVHATNTTSSPITGQLIVGSISPTQVLELSQIVDNNSNMTFQPGQTVTKTVSFVAPYSTNTEVEPGFIGTSRIIVSILSPDQSTIYYTNPVAAVFSIPAGTTPDPSPPTSVGTQPTPNPSMSAMPSSSPMSDMLTASTTVSPSSLTPTQTVSFNTTLTNTTSSTLTGGITLSVMDPTGAKVFSQLVDNTNAMAFDPNMPMTHTLSYTLPANAILGTYMVAETVVSSDGVTTYYSNPSIASFSVTSPTATPTPSSSSGGIMGDFNGDGHVNLSDLSIFASSYGTSSPNIPNPQCDLNSDGVVNLTDLSIFSSHFGT